MHARQIDHETYIAGVRDIAITHATLTDEERERLNNCQLLYGMGGGSYRGMTAYNTWNEEHATVEIAASGEESWLQLAGTTIHEYGHVLAGQGAGHSSEWKNAAERLGLRRAMASGMRYSLAALAPDVREAVERLARSISDGNPSFMRNAAFRPAGSAMRVCTAGHGTRGGTSRGVGSGSRLRKVECGTCGYIARVTRQWLDMYGAPHCGMLQHGRMAEV